ncbi:hypothetical protein BofuT4_uP075130.1 [Botrytis cinerea T4]|uniref:Uncharacterized protein n=1 Tax=Botryotinia fuckeliana (strain T4) TaxID=999810 RepID=G2XNH4_BOTF4|nr:hypothetical protein BofuT4_uP075130.1 [Botrytis cinerea T4]
MASRTTPGGVRVRSATFELCRVGAIGRFRTQGGLGFRHSPNPAFLRKSGSVAPGTSYLVLIYDRLTPTSSCGFPLSLWK